MDNVRTLAVLILYLFVLPLLLGRFLWEDKRKTQAAAWYVCGMFLLMALFQIVAVPLIILHRPLHEAVMGWSLAVGAALAFFLQKFMVNLDYLFRSSYMSV